MKTFLWALWLVTLGAFATPIFMLIFLVSTLIFFGERAMEWLNDPAK